MVSADPQGGARITVVIPAWDVADGLREAVASVSQQDEPALVLIVDNASQVVLPQLEGTRTLRLAQRTSLGGSRNAGLAHVRTPYVMFLDADDKLLPGALRGLRQALDADSAAVMAAGRVLEWNPATGRSADHGFPRRYTYRLARWPSLLALAEALRHSVPVTGATLHRADVARSAGPQPDTWGEDWPFAFSMLCRGRVVLSRHPTKLHRVQPGRPSLVKRAAEERGWVTAGTAEVRRRMRTDPAAPAIARVLAAPYSLVHQLSGRRVRRLGRRVSR